MFGQCSAFSFLSATLTDKMIRNKLVLGIQDKSTKARLLREKDLSLDKALDMCKSSEVTNKQLKSIQKDEKQNNEELNLVQDKRKSTKDKKSPHLKKNAKSKETSQTIPRQNMERQVIVVSKRSMPNRQIVQLLVSKEKVHVAEEGMTQRNHC